MPVSVRTVLDTRVLDQLTAGIDGDVDAALERVAHRAVGEIMRRAPVDTGALRASVHARRRYRGLWQVSDGVEYGADVEFGHLTRPGGEGWQGAQNFVPARPFFLPGFLKASGALVSEVRVVFRKRAAGGGQRET